MSVTTTAALTARMLRTHPGATLLVAALSFVLAAAVAIVPTAVAALADAGARASIASLAPGARDLQAAGIGVPAVGDGDAFGDERDAFWGQWQERVEALRDEVDEPLRSLLGDPMTVSRLGADYGIALAGGDGRNSVTFALDPAYADRAELVEGSWPAATSWADPETGELVPLEVVLSEDTAEALEWRIGQVQTDPNWGTSVVLTGTFRERAGSADYWYHVPSVLVPRTEFAAGTGDRIITGTGFVNPAMLETYQGAPARTEVWFPLDADRMRAADADRVLSQLRRFTATAHRVGSQDQGLGTVLNLSFHTTTIDTLEDAVATTRAMVAVVALTLSAPAGVAVAVLALACRLVARGRRPALALLATRGAAPATTRGILAMHGVAFAVLPALAGAVTVALAARAIGLALPVAAWLAVVLVAVLPAVLLAATPPPTAGLRESTGRSAAGGAARRRIRVVVELAVVVAAVIASAALVSSAVSGAKTGAAGAAGATGPAGAGLALVIAVPLLWSLAGCVVALRLVHLPVRALLAGARRRAGLVTLIGAARALREPASGLAPVLALVIGVSSAVGSGVLYGSIQHATDQAARAATGADLQIARADLDDDALAALRAVPGIDDVALISSMPAAYLRAGQAAGVDIAVVTVLFSDTAALAGVQDPAYPLLPDGPLAAAATPRVVLSKAASAAIDGETAVTLEGRDAVVAAVSGTSAPEGIGDSWALVDEASLAEIAPTRTPDRRSALAALAPGADAASVVSAVRTIVGDDALVTSPDARAAQLGSGLGAVAIRTVLLAATAGVALLGALTVVLTLTLGARGRDRTLAMLRVLGAPRRTARALIAWELWPGLAAALVVGVAIGLALPALLLATVDLRAFTGAQAAPAYHLDPVLLGGAVGGFLAVAAAFTAIALGVSRRVRAAALLRAGQEG